MASRSEAISIDTCTSRKWFTCAILHAYQFLNSKILFDFWSINAEESFEFQTLSKFNEFFSSYGKHYGNYSLVSGLDTS